jgi:hypothetical protein
VNTSIRRTVCVASCVLALCVSAATAGQPSYSENFTTTTYKDAVHTTADWNTGAGKLQMFPFAPSVVGSYDTPGGALGVTVSGDYAFVADVASGLLIFDITDPSNPQLLGSYDTSGSANAVAVDGDYACVADGASGLQVISIANPAAPTLLGTYNTTGQATDVKIDGDHVFVADGTSGLQVISIANPSSPALLGTYNTGDQAYAVDVEGDLAYVADRGDGLIIINVQNPAAPTLVGSYDTPGDSWGVAVAGDVAYVGDAASGLQVIDVSNPAAPTLITSYYPGGNCRRLDIDGDNLYSGSYSSVIVTDVTDPTNPVARFTVPLPGIATTPVVDGEHVFVADGAAGGLQIVEVNQTVAPAFTGSFVPSSIANDMAVAGDVAVVADANSGFEVVDISNPASPVVIVDYNTPGEARAVAVVGHRVFVANGSSGLRICDIADPAHPTTLGSYDTPGSAYDVAVAGDYAFVADANSGLQVINISNPASPTLAGSYFTPGFAFCVAVAGNHAFVGEGYNLRILDVTNPANPVLAGIQVFGSIVYGVAVAGDLAFVANYVAGLKIVDIRNPASPTLVGSYITPNIAQGVAVTGDLAVVAAGDLQAIDIRNPASPTLVGSYATPGAATNVALAGELAFVADFQGSCQIVQVFQREFDTARNVGRSLILEPPAGSVARARLASTQTAGVSWEVSADAGTNWQPISPDNTWNAISTPGNDLQWRATLGWTTPGLDPFVSDLHMDWLYDYAVIDTITDVPNDQGRQVRIEWTRSGHDFVGDASQITEYAIYRKIDSNLGGAAVSATPETFENLSPSARENALMMQAAGWDFVTTVPVLTEDSYAVVVPTLADSTIVAGSYLTTFRVTALTATPGVFFHSPPDSGYSVDNLAPSVPSNLAVAYNTGSGNRLSWDDPVDTDFQYFRVYRSSDPNFTPSPATLVKATVTPGWVDPDYDGGAVYYKISAVDYSGNESAAASAGTTTSVTGPSAPTAFALYPNVPNPFNPITTIHYDVPTGGGAVSLRIYDVAGRLVKTLVEGRVAPGAKSATWDGRDDAGRSVASGVYFCRLASPNYANTNKMVLMK